MAVSRHFSAKVHSFSKSTKRFLWTLKASRQGPTGSTGESGHSYFGASMFVGLHRPPRMIRYFSSHSISIKHSLALLCQSLIGGIQSFNQRCRPRSQPREDLLGDIHGKSVQSNVGSRTVRCELSIKHPACQFFVNMASNRL